MNALTRANLTLRAWTLHRLWRALDDMSAHTDIERAERRQLYLAACACAQAHTRINAVLRGDPMLHVSPTQSEIDRGCP